MASHESTALPIPELEEERAQEATLEESLSRLQEMHIALRKLRPVIPRVVSAIQCSASTPDELYSNFSNAAIGAGKDIKDFTQLMSDDRMKEVLEKARSSKEENEDGIEPWRVIEHDDWLVVKPEAIEDDDDILGTEDSTDERKTRGQAIDSEAVIQTFMSKRHDGVEALAENNGTRLVVTLPPPSNLHFQVDIDTAIEGQDPFSVTTDKKTKSSDKILEAITARPKPGDLAFLLDMLAAYTDIQSKPCHKCCRLIDRHGQFPFLRVRKGMKQADGKSDIQWQALHQSCK